MRRRAKWTREDSGCSQNPGVWDAGNGALDYHEVSETYPGITRITRESYCGRDEDNDRWYVHDENPGACPSIQAAYTAARTAPERRRKRAIENRKRAAIGLSPLPEIG